MGLKDCPACKTQVSKRVKKCPYCGYSFIHDRVSRIRSKLEWAERHLLALHAEIKAAFPREAFEIERERDPMTNRVIHRVTKIPKIPPAIPAMSGDVLQNLRSALDHLAYQLFRHHSGEKASARHICFPIFDDESNYLSQRGKKLEGIHPHSIAAIDQVKPYKGGNDVLWRLHKLNNIDKHRTLITAGTALHSIFIGERLISLFKEQEISPLKPNAPADQINFQVRPTNKKFPVKVGDILFNGIVSEKDGDKLGYSFQLSFGEPGVIEGEPLYETLIRMLREVRMLIFRFQKLFVIDPEKRNESFAG